MRTRDTLLGPVIALAVLLAACAPPAEQSQPEVDEAAAMQADKEAIEMVRDQEVAAINAGDMDAAAAVYSSDLVMLPPNTPAVLGTEGVRQFLEGMLAEMTLDLRHSTDELVVAGDWAFELWRVDLTMAPVGSEETMSEQVSGIHIYRKGPDGSWKIARDIWNSRSPLAE